MNESGAQPRRPKRTPSPENTQSKRKMNKQRDKEGESGGGARPQEIEKDFSMAELRRSLRALKSGKAPWPDGIRPEHLKNPA